MNKLGSGSRATFVSPYLRRPLRPLQKVLDEREEIIDDGAPALPVSDEGMPAASTTWGRSRKTAAGSE